MEIGIEDLTRNRSSEFGRDFNAIHGPDTFVGRIGGFCVGDVTELYLVTSLPEPHGIAVNQSPEELKELLDDITASARKISRFVREIVSVADL
jgi:hypothetical protein